MTTDQFNSGQTAKPLIMVVDDTEGVRRIIMMQLKTLGYRVVEARSGIDAVALIKRVRPALILMDINMPEVNGLETTKIIRTTEGLGYIPIIGLSAHHGQEMRQTALASGCDEFVTKPIEFKLLAALIDQYLKMN